MTTTSTRTDALRRIEKIVTRNQDLLYSYTGQTGRSDACINNHKFSHAGWVTTFDGQHAYVHVHITRADAERLIEELHLSYDEFYELVKEVGFNLSQKHLPWLCPMEIQLLTPRMRSYKSLDEFGISFGDKTDIEVFGCWVS